MAVHLLKNELAFGMGRGGGLPIGVVEGEKTGQSVRLALAPKEASHVDSLVSPVRNSSGKIPLATVSHSRV